MSGSDSPGMNRLSWFQFGQRAGNEFARTGHDPSSEEGEHTVEREAAAARRLSGVQPWLRGR